MTEKLVCDQYCKKHDQKYANYIHKCPICRGEEIAKIIKETGKLDYRDYYGRQK